MIKKFSTLILSTLTLLFALSVLAPVQAKENETTEVHAISVETGKVNINTADAKTLAATMKGVGMKKAEAIITYRNSFGPFVDIQELEDVKGIGKSTIQKNAHLIAIK